MFDIYIIIAFRGKYTGVSGLELAGTIIHQTDMGQSGAVDIGSGTLYEAHAIVSHNIGLGVFTTKALYSHWDMEINDPAQQAAETQYGWYVEPSYKMPTSMGDMGVYARFQMLDYYKGSEKNYDIWEAGVNWWVHENVVLKANYIYKEDTLNSNKDERGFDLGIGYQF